MTIGLMNAVWESSVPAPERFTLLALADRADEDGYCFPSVMYLMRKCATSERTIQRHLNALDGMGLLKRSPRHSRTNEYQIAVSALRALKLPPVVRSVAADPVNLTPRQSDTPSDCQVDPVNLSSGPRQSDTQSLTNPAEEPKGGRASAPAPHRGTRIPADFAATDEMRKWARANTPLVGSIETEQFIDYWNAESGAKATKLDWVKAWQVWMRKEQKHAASRAGSRPGNSSTPTIAKDHQTYADIHDAADADAARRLIRRNYLMPDRPRDSSLSHLQWRDACARSWIEAHEDEIRAALSPKEGSA